MTCGKMSMSDHERYQALREKFAAEETHARQLTSTMLISQAILLAAYGLLLTVPSGSPHQSKVTCLVFITPLLGLSSTTLLAVGLGMGIFAQEMLRANKEQFDLVVDSKVTWSVYLRSASFCILFWITWIAVWSA
jgi:hypothetical protein